MAGWLLQEQKKPNNFRYKFKFKSQDQYTYDETRV